MTYVMDAASITVANTNYYRIIRDENDFATTTQQPLGFIDEVIAIETSSIQNGMSRTTFTLATACQPVSENNCDTIFQNRQYIFDVTITNCENITGTPSLCIDPNLVVSVLIPLSVNDCSDFQQNSQLVVYGAANIYFKNYKYIEGTQIIAQVGDTLIIALKTSVYANSNFRAFIHYMRACTPKSGHAYAHCVTGENIINCPVVGCYNWENYDSFDSPIENIYDIMEIGYFTLTNSLHAKGCYDDEIYHSTQAQRCNTPQQCNLNADQYLNEVLDDAIQFNLDVFIKDDYANALPDDPINTTLVVFDFIYSHIACDGSLRSARNEAHKISSVRIKYT